MATTKQTPYEFLARFTDGGAFQAAHVVYRTAYLDDSGAEVVARIEDPKPITAADAAMLSLIGGQVNAAALAQLAQIQQTLSDQQAQVDATPASDSAAQQVQQAETGFLARIKGLFGF